MICAGIGPLLLEGQRDRWRETKRKRVREERERERERDFKCTEMESIQKNLTKMRWKKEKMQIINAFPSV